MTDDSIRARQSAVSKSGGQWENYVKNFLELALQEIATASTDKKIKEKVEDIVIIKMGKRREIEKIKKEYPNLYRSLLIPFYNLAKSRKSLFNQYQQLEDIFEEGIIGDTDIVVFSQKTQTPIVVVSCKTSLHGRLTETLFYALYYRITGKIKFVLATPDKGKQDKEDKWSSEWGTPEKPSKDRILSTIFLDGVYVDNVVQFMPESFDPSKEKTHIGGIVRELHELPYDILRWYEDIKFAHINSKESKS